MMRLGFGLALALAFASAACGGSSSETPPPLRPDPPGFHYSGVSAASQDDNDAPSAGDHASADGEHASGDTERKRSAQPVPGERAPKP